MSSESEKHARAVSEKYARALEEKERKWPRLSPGYASWWKSSIGQDFIRAKGSMRAVQAGEDPPHGWPVDSGGEYLPAEGPIRVFSGLSVEEAPEGWVKVNGYADLRQLMLAQIVVEYSICDAHELVDFIASQYYAYKLVFWPRDGLTERVHWDGRKAELTRKIEELTEVVGVNLEVTKDPSGHIHYVTTGRIGEPDPVPEDGVPTRFHQIIQPGGQA